MNTILLGLLAVSNLHIFSEEYARFIVLSAMLFAVFDLAPISIPDRARSTARLVFVALTVFLVSVGPLLQYVLLRHLSMPYGFIQDGALQTEEAIKLLLSGHNPYGADYARTALVYSPYWPYTGNPATSNPAFFHYLYLPMSFLLALPFYLGVQATLGWFDIRMVHLLLFVSTWAMLPLLVSDRNQRLGLQIGFGLNPFLAPFLAEGRNDIVVLFWIVLSLGLLRRRHMSAAALALGVAAATKQTAWVMLPFMLAYLWLCTPKRDLPLFLKQVLIPLFFPLVVFVVPFLAWNPVVFITDIGFMASSGYPVMGLGLSGILLNLGILPTRDSPFPFGVISILLGLPTLAILLNYLRRHATMRTMVAATAGLTAVVAYVNRLFLDNYIGYVLALAIVAWFLPERDAAEDAAR